MKFKTTATILGARKYNDSVEGEKYDFTKVRVMMPVPEGAQNEAGFNVVEMAWGTHENFEKLEKLNFPIECELELTATSKGYDFNGFSVKTTAQRAAA